MEALIFLSVPVGTSTSRLLSSFSSFVSLSSQPSNQVFNTYIYIYTYTYSLFLFIEIIPLIPVFIWQRFSFSVAAVAPTWRRTQRDERSRRSALQLLAALPSSAPLSSPLSISSLARYRGLR